VRALCDETEEVFCRVGTERIAFQPDVGDDGRFDHGIHKASEAGGIDTVGAQVPGFYPVGEFLDEGCDRFHSRRANDVVSEEKVFREFIGLQAFHQVADIARSSHHLTKIDAAIGVQNTFLEFDIFDIIVWLSSRLALQVCYCWGRYLVGTIIAKMSKERRKYARRWTDSCGRHPPNTRLSPWLSCRPGQ